MYSKRKIVLVLEGETEVVFYRRMLEYLYTQIIHQPIVPAYDIEFILARGVGNIGVRAVQTFKTRCRDCDKTEYIVFCCYDTDVFENGRMPRLWTQNTVHKFLEAGASRVHSIRARLMIEDWYLYDYEGILKFLQIPRNTLPKNPERIPGSNAAKKMNYIYRTARKVYQKGYAVDDLTAHLNIDKIYQRIKGEFVRLIEEIEQESIL